MSTDLDNRVTLSTDLEEVLVPGLDLLLGEHGGLQQVVHRLRLVLGLRALVPHSAVPGDP